MSAAVAAALKVVGHCVDTAQFDDGVCQDVVDRLETAGLATLCTTLARLADRYIHHPGAFGHGVGYKVKLWARSKAGKHRGGSSGPRLKARQGVVLFTFALRLAQAAGAGKWRSRAGEATRKEKTLASKRKKALEGWQAFTWASLRRTHKQRLLKVLIQFAPLLLVEDESFADSVLAERFHGLGAQLSMMEDTRGNLSLTQVLTKYAEMDPHTFFSKLSKYMSSTVAGTQMTALVLLQRVLGGSDRLMSRLHTSGLVKSLVSAVWSSDNADIVGLGLWVVVLVLPHAAPDAADNLPLLLDVLLKAMRMIVRASAVLDSGGRRGTSTAGTEAQHAAGDGGDIGSATAPGVVRATRGISSASAGSAPGVSERSGEATAAGVGTVSSSAVGRSAGRTAGADTAAPSSGSSSDAGDDGGGDGDQGSVQERPRGNSAPSRSASAGQVRAAVDSGSTRAATSTPSRPVGASAGAGVGAGAGADTRGDGGTPGWRLRRGESRSSNSHRAAREAARHTLHVLGGAAATLFRCLYALFPSVVLDWTRSNCRSDHSLFPLVSSLVSNVRLMPYLVLGNNTRELDVNRWRNRGVAEVVAEMQAAEAYMPVDAPGARPTAHPANTQPPLVRGHSRASVASTGAGSVDGGSVGSGGGGSGSGASGKREARQRHKRRIHLRSTEPGDSDDPPASPSSQHLSPRHALSPAPSPPARLGASPPAPTVSGTPPPVLLSPSPSPQQSPASERAHGASPLPQPSVMSPGSSSGAPAGALSPHALSPHRAAMSVATSMPSFATLPSAASSPGPAGDVAMAAAVTGPIGGMLVSPTRSRGTGAAVGAGDATGDSSDDTESESDDDDDGSSDASAGAGEGEGEGGEADDGDDAAVGDGDRGVGVTTPRGRASPASHGAGATGEGGDAASGDARAPHHPIVPAKFRSLLPPNYEAQHEKQKRWLQFMSDSHKRARQAVTRALSQPSSSSLEAAAVAAQRRLGHAGGFLRTVGFHARPRSQGPRLDGAADESTVEHLMSRVVLGQQELTFERHVARQLARRCRRLQREAVVAREATHSKALLQRHLAEAARDRRKLMDKLTALQGQLAKTQRRYDNEAVQRMGAQKAFDHEMERVDALNARLAQDVRLARAQAQQADANAARLRLQNMELQAQVLMHRNEAERLQGSEEEASRLAEEVRQWSWTYSRHIRPRLLERDHERIMQELGTAAYALSPSGDGSSDMLTGDGATGRGGLTSLRGSLSPGMFTLSSGDRTAPGTGSSGAFGSEGPFGSHGASQGTSAGNGAGGTKELVARADFDGERKGAVGDGDADAVHVPGDWPTLASASRRDTAAAAARAEQLRTRVEELEAQVEAQAATIAALEVSRVELNETWGKRMQLVEHKYSSLKALHVALQRRTMEVLASREAAMQEAHVTAGPDPYEYIPKRVTSPAGHSGATGALSSGGESRGRSSRRRHSAYASQPRAAHQSQPQGLPSGAPHAGWQMSRELSDGMSSGSESGGGTRSSTRGHGHSSARRGGASYHRTSSGDSSHAPGPESGPRPYERDQGRSWRRDPRLGHKRPGTATPPTPVMHPARIYRRSVSTGGHTTANMSFDTDSDQDSGAVRYVSAPAPAVQHTSPQSGGGRGRSGARGRRAPDGLMGRLGRLWSGWMGSGQRDAPPDAVGAYRSPAP